MSSEDFLSFGEKKVIITSSLIDKSEFSFHHNVLLTNKTSLDNYYNSIIDNVELYLDQGYPVDIIPTFKVRVWNMDDLANKNIKITKDITLNKNINKNGIRKFHSTNTPYTNYFKNVPQSENSIYKLNSESGTNILDFIWFNVNKITLLSSYYLIFNFTCL